MNKQGLNSNNHREVEGRQVLEKVLWVQRGLASSSSL